MNRFWNYNIISLQEQIRELQGEREHLRLMSDYYRVRTEKYEVLGELPQTRAAFALAGYVPAKVAGRLAAELAGRFAASVDVEGIPAEAQPPGLLHNNTFARSGEGVLASFGLPKKDELDPTGIMTVFMCFCSD